MAARPRASVTPARAAPEIFGVAALNREKDKAQHNARKPRYGRTVAGPLKAWFVCLKHQTDICLIEFCGHRVNFALGFFFGLAILGLQLAC